MRTASGDGRGYTVNVPLVGRRGRRGVRRQPLERIVAPVLESISPRACLLFSAGFDAHATRSAGSNADDAMQGFRALDPASFGRASRPKFGVGLMLEGGYDLSRARSARSQRRSKAWEKGRAPCRSKKSPLAGYGQPHERDSELPQQQLAAELWKLS